MSFPRLAVFPTGRLALPALLAMLTLALGCANAHATHTLGDGTTVHTFRRAYTNAHVVVHGGDSFMVDAGLEANAPALADDLRAAGIDPARLRAIILTHGHADHAGGAGYFHRRYGTPVIAGHGDAGLLATGHNDRLCPTSGAARDRLASDQAATYAPLAADVWIDQAQPLAPWTGVPGRVVPLPGHTPGSLVVVLGDAVFVGDLLRGAVLTSSAEVHFYMCDLPGNRRSVQALLSTLAPAARTFFPGHFGPLDRQAVVDRFAAGP